MRGFVKSRRTGLIVTVTLTTFVILTKSGIWLAGTSTKSVWGCRGNKDDYHVTDHYAFSKPRRAYLAPLALRQHYQPP
jgi:hypothetical protein